MIQPWIEQLSIAHLNARAEVTYGDSKIPMPEQGFLLCALPGVVAVEYANVEENIGVKGIKDAFARVNKGVFLENDVLMIGTLINYLDENSIPGLRSHFLQVFYN